MSQLRLIKADVKVTVTIFSSKINISLYLLCSILFKKLFFHTENCKSLQALENGFLINYRVVYNSSVTFVCNRDNGL